MNKKHIIVKSILAIVMLLSITLLNACDKNDINNDGDEEELVNIWEDKTIYNETLVLIDQNGIISGNLVFEPTEIISIKDYTLNKEYDPSEYTFEGNTIIRTSSSTMPYLSEENLHGINMPEAFAFSTYQAKEPGEVILFTEGVGVIMNQIAVTYKHEGTWAGITPAYQPENLSHVLTKLENQEDITIVFNGDSILTGANASSVLGIDPYLDDFPTLFTNHIMDKYGVNVNMFNTSVGGTVSQFGRDNVDINVNNYDPDLVVIGYGMNDGSLGVNGLTYKENIEFMIRSIKARNSETDIIVIATIVANPDSIQNQGQAAYLAELEDLQATYDFALLDMTSISQELFKTKRSVDILANNINHPSDFLVRIYAAGLVALMEE
jgi:lysophospholipase L1-like esterase